MDQFIDDMIPLYTEPDDLEQFAITMNVMNHPRVRSRLLELRGLTDSRLSPVPVTRQAEESEAGSSRNARAQNQIGGNDPAPYRIERTGERRFARAVAIERTYRVIFNDQWRGERLRALGGQLQQMFEDIIQLGRGGLQDNDLMRIIIRNQSLNHPIVIPLQAADQMSSDKVMQKVENTLQSEENLAVDDSLEVILGTIHIPQGAGKRHITELHGPSNSIHKKKSIITIVNEDNMCLARAIGVCLAKLCVVPSDEWGKLAKSGRSTLEILVQDRKTTQAAYKNICNKTRQEQRNLARRLCQLAGISETTPGSLSDIRAFETALRVRIAVIASALGNKFVKSPSSDNPDWPILYLYMVEEDGVNNFHGITKITGFLGYAYFCDVCLVPYSSKTRHSCKNVCIVCQSNGCTLTEDAIVCSKCNMTCRSVECFARHRKESRSNKGNVDGDPDTMSLCKRYWRCRECKKIVDRKLKESPHKCGEWLCGSCREWVEDGHLCYLYPDKPKSPESSFIFFDFEATQDTIAQCERGYNPADNPDGPCANCKRAWCGQQKHIPNFVVAQTACSFCMDQSIEANIVCPYCGTRCEKCNAFDKKKLMYLRDPCKGTCGQREVIFKGDNTVDNFGRWLFSDMHKNAVVMAHNMKGYDGMFLLDYLMKNSVRPNKILFNGTKIMYMEIERGLNIKVLDSLNFLPMKLADFPKTFGFEEQCKGYFPYFFNRQENQEYVGAYPEPHFYGDHSMKENDRETFLKWHKEKVDSRATFNFQQELKNYCRSDVEILRRACLDFRRLLLQITDVDPFNYITIASVCMGVYKTLFLDEEYIATLTDSSGQDTDPTTLVLRAGVWTCYVNGRWQKLSETDYAIKSKKRFKTAIGQIPSSGYSGKGNHSKSSIQWLEYLQRESDSHHRIQHALNEGELEIRGTRYKVDGYCHATKTVYEFHGCLWHGCKDCYPANRQITKTPRGNQSMDELYALTMIKKKIISDLGYKYVSIWEHEWHKLLSENKDVADFVSTIDIQERLCPRESFYGGRTNACKLYYKATGDEKIKYADFCSLYPYVNKYAKYPKGHPEIIVTNFDPDPVNAYFGLIKVKILPPKQLYHPVLPIKVKNKLLFPLCRTCALTNARTCKHSDEDRALMSTWCSPEIEKAVEKGYKILKIYEVYHFPETSQYDSATKQGGLFASYVNTFLKYKQESSDWPSWCVSDEDKTLYVLNYLQKEGIELDATKIGVNPGLRTLAKLCLNSFWGKFGQRLDRSQSRFFHELELADFFQLLTDASKQVKDFHIINKEMIQVEWQHQSRFIPEDMRTNIFLATFTTSWARLKLYDVLDKLDQKVLYFDTDSVIYINRPREYEPPFGDFLGDLTNELKTGEYITEFASGGPKNYTFTTSSGRQICKIRGFSLNYKNSQLLNFRTVKEMVLNYVPGQSKKRRREEEEEDLPAAFKKHIVTVNPSKITRDSVAHIVYNRQERKNYTVVYDKRIILDDLDTVPYGYELVK